jgi:S-adenosylhomocysteine hydrolase
VTAANTVILTLGNKEVLLSDSQMHALRDMAVYANSGRKR